MKLYPTVLIPDLEDGLFTPVENVYLLTVDEIKKIVSDALRGHIKRLKHP